MRGAATIERFRKKRPASGRDTITQRTVGHSIHILAAGGAAPDLLVDLLVVLTMAGLVALVMRRLRVAVVPAYLIAGMIAGPGALKLVSSTESMEGLARLAIVLLLFGIGLQLHLSALKSALGRFVIAGVGSTLGSTALLWPVGIAFGLSAPSALAVAMALSLSSTAVVLQLLSGRREMNRRHGRLSFAILVIQDLIVLGMLAAIPAISAWANASLPTPMDSPPDIGAFALDSLKRAGGLALIVVIAKWAVPRVLAEATKGQGADVLLVLTTAIAIGAAAATQGLGFSPELGAFLAGFTLASTPMKHQISGQIGPLRDLFVAVFFTAVGMRLAPATLIELWIPISIGLTVMILVKTVSIGAWNWAVGAGGAASTLVALTLAQAGEFGLLMLASIDREGMLSRDEFDTLVAIVVLSLILTPTLASLGRLLAPLMRNAPLPPWIQGVIADAPGYGDFAKDERYVVLAGYGPVGRTIAEALEAASVRYTIIEMNPRTVRDLQEKGISAVYGDASNPEVLDSAGIMGADALVLTIPDEEASLRACETARRVAPDAFIAARTTLASRGDLATTLGADHVTVDELATAEKMRDMVMQRLRERRATERRAEKSKSESHTS